MAQGVLIIGESGSGKSTSGRNLDPKETLWINVANKSLPFKGWKTKYTLFNKDHLDGNMSVKNKPGDIINVLKYVSEKRPEIKTIVVDDWQYASAFEFFEKAGDKGYDKFNVIGQHIAAMARAPITLREDLVIFFLTHAEDTIDSNGNKSVKAKTVGKMVDNALTLEGLFSIVLYGKAKLDAKSKEMNYVFETKTDGKNTCKSPMDMFETTDIPNDLQIVKEAILKYEQ